MQNKKIILFYRATMFIDVVLITISFGLAYFLMPLARHFIIPGDFVFLAPFREYAWILIIILPLMLWLLDQNGFYSALRKRPYPSIFMGILKATTIGIAILTFFLFVFKVQYISRLLIFVFYILSTLSLFLEKTIFKRTMENLQKKGFNQRNILIIGSKKRAQEVIKKINEEAEHNYVIFGLLEIDPKLMGKEIYGSKVIGMTTEMKEVIFKNPIDEIVITIPLRDLPDLNKIIECIEELGVRLHIMPDYQIARYDYCPSISKFSLETFTDLSMLTLSPVTHSLNHLLFKRMIDTMVSLLLLIFLSPLFLLISLAVKLSSSGPIFYKWNVVGFNGREFTSYKFRTMVENADRIKEKLSQDNEMKGPVFKIKNDPRVLPVGKFLRKYSLDEIPQLWSVFKGDMSLVGPRPPLKTEAVRFDFWHKRKLSIRPGITCLWQINGRNKINDFNEWVKLDLQYIDNWSLWLDLKILLKTIPAVLKGSGH